MGAGRPQLLYSLSKSFTSTAAAFAQAEGLLDLDDTVISHFAEFAADITGPRSRSVKVRHVASMATGHTRDMLAEAIIRDPGEPVRGLLLIPPDRDPGTVFACSQPCTYALASIIQRNAGMPLSQYLRPRLLQISNPGEPSPDWQQGYGFQFWMSRHGYRGDGAFGQFCVILPEQETVIVTTACTVDMQAVLDAMWTHLLPGLGTVSPGSGSAQDQLSARLAGRELPACPAAPAPADWAPWTSGPFNIAASTAGTPVQPALTSIEVAPEAGGWQISLNEPASALTLPVGTGAWTVSDHADRNGETIPVAASGGWLDGRTLRAEVIFLETPHRMDITCSLPGRTAEAVWRHPPLTPGKLQHLHCPRLGTPTCKCRPTAAGAFS